MSIKNYQAAFYFYLFIYQFCFGTFPLTNTITQDDNCLLSVRKIHEELKKPVKLLSSQNEDGIYKGTNYFACAFSFLTTRKVTLPAEQSSIRPGAPLVAYSQPRQRTVNRRLTIPLTEELVKNASLNPDFLQLIGQIKNKMFVFRSNPNSGDYEETYKEIVDLQAAFYEFSKNEGLNVRLLAANFSIINQRIESAPQNYALVNTDSEAHAIAVFQNGDFMDGIYQEILSKLASNEYVTAIEFHGCTTRDMCALCYTNFNILQYLTLNPNSTATCESFLGYLKRILREKNVAIPSCPTTMIISSLQEFPTPDKGGNQLWPPASDEPGLKLNWLNQFRLGDAI